MIELSNSPPRLTLRLRTSIVDKLDGSALNPASLSQLSRSDIAGLSLKSYHRHFRLGDLFEIIGDPSDDVAIFGDCSSIDAIGKGAKQGRLAVMGNVGDRFGEGLFGARLDAFGDAANYVGSGMRSGTLVVHGSIQDHGLGPTLGATRGMRGGTCLIRGNVGHRFGERLRRGVAFVGGNCLDYGAAQMIAGTIVVMGQIGERWAQGLRRGSIIVTQSQASSFAALLTQPREFELSFLPLLWNFLKRHFEDLGLSVPNTRWAARQIGDRANGGTGEILTLLRI